MCRPIFILNDNNLRIDRSLINSYAGFKNLLDSNEIDVSPEITEQGTDKLSVLTPNLLKEADTIIVDNDETEISVRHRLDNMVFTGDEAGQ